MPINRGGPLVEREPENRARATGIENTHKMAVPAHARSCEQAWHASGICLEAGDRLELVASGAIALSEPSSHEGTPDGLIGIKASESYLAAGLDRYALVGKIGPDGRPFQVGWQATLEVEGPGELFLGVNDEWFEYNSGSFEVLIRVD